MSTRVLRNRTGAAAALLPSVAAAQGQVAAQPPLDYSGVASAIRLDQLLSGHLLPVNGKYELRASEVCIDPAGHVGPHQQVGPGLRNVLAGEVTLVEDGNAEVFRAGDCFYQPGDATHRLGNRGDEEAVVLQVELLPAAAGRATTDAAREPQRRP